MVPILALLYPPWASADLTLSQEIEGGPQTGEIVMRLKGDRLRLDLPAGPNGRMSTILDIVTGDTTTLRHDKKLAVTRTGAELKEAARKAGADSSRKIEPPKPANTGLKERVGEYEAEVFTMFADASKDTLWVVRDFPNFPGIKADLMRVSQATATGLNRAGTLDVSTLPGMVVKRQKERGGRKMTITLKSVGLEAIEDSTFTIPPDYKPIAPRTPASAN